MSYTTAIILAAGQGKRMNSDVHKQYLLINDRPILYYSLKAFENSFIDNIVLVIGKGEQEYCKKEIVEKYGIQKISAIVEGGKERYHSVAYGLRAINWNCDYVFIHDGARPFVDNEILNRVYHEVIISKACVVGMPVKDTIKIADSDECVDSTPDRNRVWQVQTPQVFDKRIILESYEKLLSEESDLISTGISITDDAMVLEYYTDCKIKLVMGSYQNIKITTPEDLEIAKVFMDNYR